MKRKPKAPATGKRAARLAAHVAEMSRLGMAAWGRLADDSLDEANRILGAAKGGGKTQMLNRALRRGEAV